MNYIADCIIKYYQEKSDHYDVFSIERNDLSIPTEIKVNN